MPLNIGKMKLLVTGSLYLLRNASPILLAFEELKF